MRVEEGGKLTIVSAVSVARTLQRSGSGEQDCILRFASCMVCSSQLAVDKLPNNWVGLMVSSVYVPNGYPNVKASDFRAGHPWSSPPIHIAGNGVRIFSSDGLISTPHTTIRARPIFCKRVD